MREIKFRAWNKRHKFMAYLDKVEIIGTRQRQSSHRFGFEVDLTFFIPEIGIRGKYQEDKAFFGFDNLIWMQYTGLKDSKNREIYEGDIYIHCEKTGYYANKKDKYVVKDLQDYFENKGLSEGEYGSNFSQIEVIGNIYENKELLK